MKWFVGILNCYYWFIMTSANNNNTRPPLLTDLSKMNGTWEGYKKANLNLNVSCLTYNTTCSEKQCNLTVIRTNPLEVGIMKNLTLNIVKESVKWDEDSYVNVSLGDSQKYAVVWIDGKYGKDDKLLVLLKGTKEADDATDADINKTISMLNLNKHVVRKIDHSECGSGIMISVSPISVFILAFLVISSSS